MRWDARLLTLISLLFPFGLPVEAQESAVQVTMTDDAKVVIAAENFSTLGFQFVSESGSLVPASPGATPSPFEFYLNNSPTQITFGSLGVAPVIDGSVTLPIGWNSQGLQDLTYAYGDGPTIVGPFPISSENYGGTCIDCVWPPLPPIEVGLTPEFNFTLTGLGHQLTAFEFTSEGGSLRPAVSPAPFATLADNSVSRVRYEQLGENITLDGTVTLDSGWNDILGARDVVFRYEHTDLGNVVQEGATVLQRSAYPPLQNWSSVRAQFNADSFAVLTGTGQPLRSYSFKSASGSLIPGADPGPFATVTGDSNLVRYDAGPDNFVTLDGSLVLNTQWKLGEPESRRDVNTEYVLAGNPGQRTSRILGYPSERSWSQIGVHVDAEDRFVLNGIGHPLRRFDLSSRSGSLIPSEDLGPFRSFASNDDGFVSYEAGDNVILDGSITLGTKWDRLGEKDVRVAYDLDKVARDTSFNLSQANYPVVPVCFDGQPSELGITIDKRNRFVLQGNGHKVTELSIASASGSLVPGESAVPFESFNSNSPELVHFASNELVTIDGTVVLSTRWNEEASTMDVLVDFGETELPLSAYRTCTNDPFPGDNGGIPFNGIFLDIIGDEVFLVANEPVEVSGLDLTSQNGFLVPVPDAVGPGPFTFFLSNTSNQIIWGNLGTTVTVDGYLSTGTRYIGNNPRSDLMAFFGDGAAPVQIPIFSEVVPEPTTGCLLWTALLVCLAGRGGRKGKRKQSEGESRGALTIDTRCAEIEIRHYAATMRRILGPAAFAVALCGCVCFLVGPARGQDLVVVLNEESRFVVTAPNGPFETNGLDFISPSGSLIPASDPAESDPFMFFLSNVSQQITYGNLLRTVTIDGELTLSAGWDPTGTQDVTFAYGIGMTGDGSEPYLLPPGAYDGACGDCFPIAATIDGQNRFVISGLDKTIRDITFSSPSGSLRPGTDPGPFASITGTPEAVTFTADGTLDLDGSQTLDLRWGFGEIGSARDVSFTYRLAADEPDSQRQITLRASLYPERQPITVSFNDADNFVLSGTGHPLSEFTLNSRSGSLTEGNDAGPFESLVSSSPESIQYSAGSNPVVLDGDITLPSGWAFGERTSQRDVDYTYRLADDSLEFQGRIPSNAYPNEIAWPRIGIAINDEDHFVLTGNGQPLKGLVLSSASRSLIPSPDIRPFDSTLANSDAVISLESDQHIVLDGTLVLQSQWDRRGERDVRYTYDLDDVSADVTGSISRADYPLVPSCRDGEQNALGVSIDKAHRFVLSGDGPLMRLELSSESGSLIPGESSAPFASLDSNTAQLVQFTNDEFMMIDGSVVLSTQWNPEVGTHDVKVDLGPRPLTDANTPSCFEVDPGSAVGGQGPGSSAGGTSDGVVFATINGGELLIFTEGGSIQTVGIDIRSEGGHLIPIDGFDASPFAFFLSNTSEQITMGNLGLVTTLDGEWRTGIGYSGTDPLNDLTLAWGDGPRPMAFPVVVSLAAQLSDVAVPEPNASLLLVSAVFSMVLVRKRELAPRKRVGGNLRFAGR